MQVIRNKDITVKLLFYNTLCNTCLLGRNVMKSEDITIAKGKDIKIKMKEFETKAEMDFCKEIMHISVGMDRADIEINNKL